MFGFVFLFAGLIALVAWAVSRARGSTHTPIAATHSDPLEIVRARFARGEITEGEYTQAMTLLGSGR